MFGREQGRDARTQCGHAAAGLPRLRQGRQLVDGVVSHALKNPVDAFERPRRLPFQEEFQRLRHPERHHGQHGGGEQTGQQEDRRPAEVGQHVALDDDNPEHGGPYRVAGLNEGNGQVAAPPRRKFSGHRSHAGENSAHAQARDKPQHVKLGNGPGECRGDHAGRDDRQAQHDQLSPTDHIRQRREKQGAQGHAEQRSAEHAPELSGRYLPILREHRRGQRDGEHIHAVEHVDEEAQPDHDQLQFSERAFVDGVANVHDRTAIGSCCWLAAIIRGYFHGSRRVICT